MMKGERVVRKAATLPLRQGPDLSGASNGESRLWTTLFSWTVRIALAAAVAYVALVVGLILLVVVVFMLVLFVGRRAVRHSGW